MLCLCSRMVVYGRRWFPGWSRQSSLWSTDTPSPPKVQMIHASNVILLWLHMSLWDDWSLGWSEKSKSWKMQKYWADSEPRHSTDFRTIFGIMNGWFVFCEIGQKCFTESGGSFGTLWRPDFKPLHCLRIWDWTHIFLILVTCLISE